LDRAGEIALDVKPLSFVSTEPGTDICDVARVRAVDLVLLGWRTPILGRGVLGGTIDHVMEHAEADVGLLVDRGVERVRRVLVAALGPRQDHAGIEVSRRFRDAGAEVVVSRRSGIDAALEESARGYDLLVVGSAGGDDLRSTCDRLAREATTSVLIVRGRGSAAHDAIEEALPDAATA